MKQKQTRIIFYLFLLITLALLSYAGTAFSVAMSTGSPLSDGRPASLSSPGHLIDCCDSPVRCPRELSIDPDHERWCMAAYEKCMDGCCNRIRSNATTTEIAKRRRNCCSECTSNYNACLGQD